jgi:hypothetical protein
VKFSSNGVLIALIVATATAIGGLCLRKFWGDNNALSAVPIIQVFITFFTGWWFWNRIRYTDTRGAPKPGVYSVLFSSIILLTGLMCFFFVGNPTWFALLAILLLLATEKDIEIIISQKRLLKIQRNEGELIIRWRKYIVVHHWYSILRDLSMCFWWIVAGLQLYIFGTLTTSSFLCFAVPYILLVLGWWLLKNSALEKEAFDLGLPEVTD